MQCQQFCFPPPAAVGSLHPSPWSEGSSHSQYEAAVAGKGWRGMTFYDQTWKGYGVEAEPKEAGERERERQASMHRGWGGNCHKRIGRNQLSDRLLSLDTVSPAVSGHSVVAIFLFSNGLLWFCGENDNSLFCFIFSESIRTTSFIFQFGTRTQERWPGHMRTEGRDTNRIGGQCNHSWEQLVERWERGRMKVVLMSCTQPRGFNLPVRPSDFSLTLSPLWGPQPGYCPRRTDVFRCTGKGCLGAKAFPSVSLLLEMDVSPLGE